MNAHGTEISRVEKPWGYELHWAQTETDNLRGAFAWSRENSDLETAVQLIASSGAITRAEALT